MMKKDILRVGDIATTNRPYSFKGVVIRVTKVHNTHYNDGVVVSGAVITEGTGRYYNSTGMGWSGFEKLYGFEDYYNEVK